MAEPRYAVNDETGEVMRNDGSGWTRVRSAKNDDGQILINEGGGWQSLPTQTAQPTSYRSQNPDLQKLQQLALAGDKDALRSQNSINVDNAIVASRPQPDLNAMYGDPSDDMMERSAALANGATFALGDELAGVVAGPHAREGYRSALNRGRQERPLETMGLELLGATATGGTGAGAARSMGVKAGAGTTGAVSGMIYGGGDANEGNRAVGAAMGGALGAAGGKAVEGVEKLGRFALSLVRSRSGQAAKAATGAIDDIKLTYGQQTGDAGQIAFEQAAARGGRGGDAQAVMRPFMEDQQNAVVAAGRGLAGDNYSTVNEAGRAVASGVRQAAETARQGVDDAYEAARAYGARMRTEGVQRLGPAVEQGVPEDIRFLMDASPAEARTQFPATTSAVNAAKSLAREVTNKSDDATRVTALDFRRIELARRAINRAIDGATNRADRAGAISAKKAFDEYLDSAVDDALFEGDDAFLEAYRRARGLRADYARNFEANKVIDKIINNDANEVQIVNYLLGGAKVAGERATRVIPQLKNALGEASEEWGALKEAAVKRLMQQTERTFNPKVLADNLKNATEGNMAPVFRQLLDPQEFAAMQRLESVVRQIIPPQGSVNTSNTAYELQRALGGSMNRIPGMTLFRATWNKLMPDTNAQRARAAISPGAALPRTPRPAAEAGAGAGSQLFGLDRWDRMTNPDRQESR